MGNDFKKIANYWKSQYSSNIENYKRYEAGTKFEQVASLFSSGEAFYYILNMHNLEIEYISKSVQYFTGILPDEVGMGDLLSLAIPCEIESIQLKEKIIKDFYLNFLNPEEILDYKVIYSYKMKDHKGKERVILHQASALSITDTGILEHVFSVHTDISHLNSAICNQISFVHMHGGKSYYNLKISKGVFDPALANQENFKKAFSSREKEIIEAIAKGESAEEIAESLCISSHTVKTHRKNILQKSGCKNTAELIAQCLVGGVISIG
jgi:DNA-binding CsgD family transcriptional regulator